MSALITATTPTGALSWSACQILVKQCWSDPGYPALWLARRARLLEALSQEAARRGPLALVQACCAVAQGRPVTADLDLVAWLASAIAEEPINGGNVVVRLAAIAADAETARRGGR